MEHLNRLVAKTRPFSRLQEYNPEHTQYQIQLLHVVEGLSQSDIQKFGTELAEYLGISPDDTIRYRYSPEGAGGNVVVRHATPVFVAHARVKSAEMVISEFEELLTGAAEEVTQVAAFWGLHPEEPFEIWDRITLGPLSALPPSLPRDLFLQIGERLDGVVETNPMMANVRPRAALWCSDLFGPLVTIGGFSDAEQGTLRYQEMSDIVSCLALLADRALAIIASWSQSDVTRFLVGGVGSWGSQATAWENLFEIERHPVDQELARTVVSNFFKLSDGDRQRMRAILGRLNSAKASHRSQEDRAIDLGIALEALLFNPNDTPSEISFKFRVRGSVLASNDPVKRKQAFEILNRIYSLRSKAAHGVTFRGDRRNRRSPGYALLDEDLELAETLIRRVLEIGHIPQDWNGHILGWSELPS
ncbi:hypothetical protein [Kribbella sp. HUAS MG21]|uniref:Apea-like HEPN domain-containing protein n=1 Tax=Kribbella sp. HUAS MG21 TaxID=3160966 RepID=A0AAU7TDP3_9ACTN